MLSSSERDNIFHRYPLLGTIGHTPLVRVDVLHNECPEVEVYAKLEYFNPGGSLKDRPVRQILLDALASGALCPGKTILDSSSGNAGIAYAMLGAVLGYPVALVVPENASLERLKKGEVPGLLKKEEFLGKLKSAKKYLERVPKTSPQAHGSNVLLKQTNRMIIHFTLFK